MRRDLKCRPNAGANRADVPVVLAISDLVDRLRVERLPFPHPNFSDIDDYRSGRDCFRGRAALQMEVVAFRHQLNVVQRSRKRPKLTASDRFLWAQQRGEIGVLP
jgi:hypothetical protein